MHVDDFFHLRRRISRIARDADFAYMRLRSGNNRKLDSDLLRVRVFHLCFGDGSSVVTVLFEQLLDALQGAVDVVPSEQLSQLELRGVYDLAHAGPVRIAFDRDVAHKVVWRGNELQPNLTIGGALSLHANIGEAPRGIERLDAFADLVTVERLSRLLHDERM